MTVFVQRKPASVGTSRGSFGARGGVKETRCRLTQVGLTVSGLSLIQKTLEIKITAGELQKQANIQFSLQYRMFLTQYKLRTRHIRCDITWLHEGGG